MSHTHEDNPEFCKTQYSLTLNLLTTTIVALPSNASKWQMGFNSAFKGLILDKSQPLVHIMNKINSVSTLKRSFYFNIILPTTPMSPM